MLAYLKGWKKTAPSSWVDFDSIDSSMHTAEITGIFRTRRRACIRRSSAKLPKLYCCPRENGYSRVYHHRIEQFLPVLSTRLNRMTKGIKQNTEVLIVFTVFLTNLHSQRFYRSAQRNDAIYREGINSTARVTERLQYQCNIIIIPIK